MEKVKSPTKIMKIILDVENGGSSGWKQKWKRTNRGQIYMKITVSRIPPNQWKSSSYQLGFWKSTWILKMLLVWGWKNIEIGQTGGKIYMKSDVSTIPPNQK